MGANFLEEEKMAVFKDKEMMYEVLGGLFKLLFEDENFMEKYRKAGVSIKFLMKDPEGIIYISLDGVEMDKADKADVEMTLSGDTAHNFWLKKIKLPVALATGKVKTRGSLPKVLKLLPILGPAHAAYPGVCEKHGLPI